jgi:hypothetical protein
VTGAGSIAIAVRTRVSKTTKVVSEQNRVSLGVVSTGYVAAAIRRLRISWRVTMRNREQEAAKEILSGDASVGRHEPLPEDQPDYVVPTEVGLVDGPSVKIEKLTPQEAYIIGQLLAKISYNE